MSFYKAIATVGGMTLLSRLCGFARDILTATYLGAGPVADAFFVALKLPNFFRKMTAEGAFSVSFVPLFAKELETDGRAQAIRFAEEAQAMMLAVLIPFTIVAIVAMPWVLMLIAPGFGSTPERYALAVELSRITFPYILLMSLTSLLGGILNSFDRFGPFAAAPVLFNLTLIVAMLYFADFAGSAGHAMAWGVAVAGVLQFGWLLWCCRKLGIRLRLRKPALTPQIRMLFRKMTPGIFGASIAQINIFVDMIIASLLPVGAISFLYYADRMYQLPLSVVGIAIGTAILPMLTRALASDDEKAAPRLFRQGFELSLMLALPATVAYLLMAPEIMQVLFVRGEFTQDNSYQAAMALMGYSIGLPAFILAKLLSAAFFAQHDTATPVRYAVICAVMNTGLALLLSQLLKEQGLGHVGIALATGATAWVNVALLAIKLHKRGMLMIDHASFGRAAEIAALTVLMGAVLWGASHAVLPYLAQAGQVNQLLGVLGVLALGGGVYGIGLFASGALSLQTLQALFPKRAKKATIVTNEQPPEV